MNYRAAIPPDLLRKFDELGPSGVQAMLDIGAYGGKKKKYAALFVAQSTAERDASADERGEVRAEDALSISRAANSIALEAVQIARRDRIVAIIAAIAAIIAAAAAIFG